MSWLYHVKWNHTPSACQENLRIWTIRSWGFWRIFLGNSLLIFELVWWMAKESFQVSNHILQTPYIFAPPKCFLFMFWIWRIVMQASTIWRPTANPGAIDLGNDFGHGEKGECSVSHDRRHQGQLSNPLWLSSHLPPSHDFPVSGWFQWEFLALCDELLPQLFLLSSLKCC